MTAQRRIVHGHALELVTLDTLDRIQFNQGWGVIGIYVPWADQWVFKPTSNIKRYLTIVLKGNYGSAIKNAKRTERVAVYYNDDLLTAHLAECALGAKGLFCPAARKRAEVRTSDPRRRELAKEYLLTRMGALMAPEERWEYLSVDGGEVHPFYKAVDALLTNVNTIRYDKAIPSDAFEKAEVKLMAAYHRGYKRAAVVVLGDLTALDKLEPALNTPDKYLTIADSSLGIQLLEVMLEGNPELDSPVMVTMRQMAAVCVTAGYELRMRCVQNVDEIPILCYVNPDMPVQVVFIAECALLVATGGDIPNVFKKETPDVTE